MNPRSFHLHCEGAYPLPPRKVHGPVGTRNVIDCIADIDMEDIEEMLAPIRAQLPHPESELWRLEPCDLEIYREIQAETKINPRGLAWPGLAFVWDTPEDEEVDAA